MRKIIIVVLLAFLTMPVFAQTRVGEIPNYRPYRLYGVAKEFVMSGQIQLVGVDGYDASDSVVFLTQIFKFSKP